VRKRLTTQRMAALVSALLLTLVMAVPASAGGNGATQISGVGLPDTSGVCDDFPPQDIYYAIVMDEGSLKGCVYGFFDPEFKIGPSGVAKERADEIFVGSYDNGTPDDTGDDLVGRFGMTENWHAKYDPASGIQKFGFCKHPIVRGSGTDDFDGVRGRLDFRDDLTGGPGNELFIYKGHLKNLD